MWLRREREGREDNILLNHGRCVRDWVRDGSREIDKFPGGLLRIGWAMAGMRNARLGGCLSDQKQLEPSRRFQYRKNGERKKQEKVT